MVVGPASLWKRTILHDGHLSCLHGDARFASVTYVADASFRSSKGSIEGSRVIHIEEECYFALCHTSQRRPCTGKELFFRHPDENLFSLEGLRRWYRLTGREPE